MYVMHPFIKRIGGKFYLRNNLYKFMPKTLQDYIEPFVGGGSVFLGMKMNGISVKGISFLNDLDDDIFTVWNVFWDKEKFTELMKLFDNFALYSESIFEFFQVYNPHNEIEKAFKILLLAMSSYQGNGESYYIGIGDVGRRNAKIYNPRSYWKKYVSYLKEYNVKISHRDYSVFLEKPYNRTSSFWFIDPPYYGTRGYDGLPFEEEDYEHLFELLTNVKGRFMLTINDCDYIRELFGKTFIRVKLQTRWASNAKSDMNTDGVQELLYMNYKPNIKKKGKSKKLPI